MNGLIGHIGTLLGLVAAVAGVVTIVSGLVTKRPDRLARGAGYAYLSLGGALVGVVAMEHALLTHDFSLAFVYENNSRGTPLLYTVTGLWSALQGSILLWVLILTAEIAIVVRSFRARLADPVVAGAVLVALVIAVFFFALMAGPADPFASTGGVLPSDGLGPNALLQDNLLIAFHPVFLYIGYVGFTIPFAFAVASLAAGRIGEGWLVETRRFTVISFGFLTVGIVLGAWWSYQVLGWGGFWGWDPVENAALLPWLTATAYLHSVMIQERRGILRIWNLSLLIATFALTILGTFLTRSGVVQSVHAFSDSGVGPALIGLFAAVIVTGVGLIGWRGDSLRSSGGIDAPVSREGAFLLNNFLFAAFAAVVLIGTVFPLFVETFSGQQVSIGRPYFDAFTVPLGMALLFFMAIAPVLPWRKAAPAVLRQRLVVPAWVALLVVVALVLAGIRGLTPLAAFGLGAFAATSALRQLVLSGLAAHRRQLGIWRGVVGRANGGMVVHLGVIVIAVALTAASSFGQRVTDTLGTGQAAHVDGHTVTLLAVRAFSDSAKTGEEAVLRVDRTSILRPTIATFRGDSEPVATPAIDSSIRDDVYLAPGSIDGAAGHASATLQIIVQPLVVWLWAGGALAGLGSLLAAVPGRRRRPTDPASIPLPELADELLVGVGAQR